MPQIAKSLSPAPAGIAGAISANERVAFDLCRAGAAQLVVIGPLERRGESSSAHL